MSTCAFPKDFLWAVATASYQVEGAAKEDGRLPSIWDTFSYTPGKVREDHNGDMSCDQYHRYREDVQLLKWLGVKAYRFSVAWPRVMPTGRNPVNVRGLDYYDRLVDELLANGIQPWCTIFHWDLPQALQDEFGGWRDRRIVDCFGDYTAVVAQRLGDRVRSFFTINEMGCISNLGHYLGIHAPGLTVTRREFAQVTHHVLMAHGRAVQALRANCSLPPQVGVAENPSICVPVMETPEHIVAARNAFRIKNARYITALMEGRYLPEFLEEEGKDAPQFSEADMQLIGQPLDFVGLNMYAPDYIRADPSAKHGFVSVPLPKAYPRMVPEWLFLGPSITYWGPRFLQDVWGVKSIYITENGCACDDRPEPDGEIWDTDRTMYLRQHFISASRAVKDGVPLKGYFVWSLMDNFEWQKGYTERFGIVYVNYQTLKRTPKLSAKFYREVIARSEVV